jgi:hypothetical protein
MKRIIEHFESKRLGHKLHQLQKRYNRAIENGYTEKAEAYKRRINSMLEKLSHIKGHGS